MCLFFLLGRMSEGSGKLQTEVVLGGTGGSPSASTTGVTTLLFSTGNPEASLVQGSLRLSESLESALRLVILYVPNYMTAAVSVLFKGGSGGTGERQKRILFRVASFVTDGCRR